MFFGFMQVASIFYVIFLLPETKEVPLEYMDDLFEKYKSSPRTAHRKVMEEVENDRARQQETRVAEADTKSEDIKV